MSNFGELVLVVGDYNEGEIPEKFKRMLVPNKMQHIFCTGNLGSKENYDELRQLAPNVHVVSGDYESSRKSSLQMTFPESKVVQIGEFRIGLVHGHQIIPWGDHLSLASFRRKLNVDILLSGHTHNNEVVEQDGFYHINPGSITGAYSSLVEKVIPSFILLAIQGSNVVCYVYELIDGELEVSKTDFAKNMTG